MRRHLPRLLLTGALLSPVTLYALGLGEIRLNSALNQPFNAEIELLSPTPEELGSLKVTMANQDVFSRYGIDRPAYLSNFEFSVSRGSDGKASIKVSSNRSVTEPYVTLLVEASWARGRLVREYTVLLDPPVFMPSQETPAPVATPQSATTAEGRIERRPSVPAPEPTAPAVRPQPAPQPVPAPLPSPAPSPTAERTENFPASQVAASPGSEYTVQRNDTLSKIASSAIPGQPSVVNRTMIAVFRANPQAFSGNINRLRAGSVLRIPELSEIESISAGEASAEVSRQTSEWSGGMVADTTPESERLRLVTPAETPAPPVARPTQSDRQPSSASPGTPRTPDRRLEVTDPGLAQVQKNVEPAPEQLPDEEVVPPVEAQTPSESTPPTEEPAAPIAEAPPATPPAATPAVPEPTLSERLGQYWWLVIALGLLVVVVAMMAFIRRRRDSEEDTIDSLSSSMGFDPPLERPARALAPSGKGRAEAFLVEGEDDAGLLKTNLEVDFDEPSPPPARREPARARSFEPAAPVSAAPIAARGVDDTMSSESAVRFDQQDALAEADFHMAYGLYDQAADLVKIAIDREPSRRDLKLKLLEIYFVWGNKDLFLDTARDLYDTRDQAAAGEWDKVLIMGKQIAPEDVMFEGGGTTRVDLVDVNLEGGENRVDVDLFAEPGSDGRQGLDLEFGSGERRGPNSSQANTDLDFLLDEQSMDASEEPTRELDPLARTQETPTVESPLIDRVSPTVRERVDQALFNKGTSTGDTAELSIDDLGLDVDDVEHGRGLEDTSSLEKDEDVRALRDDEMTQLAPSLSSFDRTMEAPRVERFAGDGDGDIDSTGTIYIDQVDLSGGGDTVEHPRPNIESTAAMRKLNMTEIDLDLDDLSPSAKIEPDTLRQPRKDEDRFSNDVFAERTSEIRRVDLDVGDALSSDDREPTHRQTTVTTEMELSELDPVTMSEVGTKLDLARAYMDMGDPDGARSILDEVLSEGNPSQKQEAQRLMDSIR